MHYNNKSCTGDNHSPVFDILARHTDRYQLVLRSGGCPGSDRLASLNNIITTGFAHVDPNDIKTLTHQTSVTIADQQYDIIIKRIGKDVEGANSADLSKDSFKSLGFVHKPKEITVTRNVNNRIKISTTKEIFVVDESDPLRVEVLEMLSNGYGQPGVEINPILEKKYNQGLSYPKNNGAATHYGYLNRNSKEKPIDYLYRVYGKYLQNRAWVMYRYELCKQDPSLESMLRDTIGGELRNHIPSKPPKELLSRLKMTP